MPYIVVIIDEFGDLIMTAGKEVELPIARIAQLARAIGIHMIIATQRPTTNIITGTIKANFPARVAFRVSSMMDSRTILGPSGSQSAYRTGRYVVLARQRPGSCTMRLCRHTRSGRNNGIYQSSARLSYSFLPTGICRRRKR